MIFSEIAKTPAVSNVFVKKYIVDEKNIIIKKLRLIPSSISGLIDWYIIPDNPMANKDWPILKIYLYQGVLLKHSRISNKVANITQEEVDGPYTRRQVSDSPLNIETLPLLRGASKKIDNKIRTLKYRNPNILKFLYLKVIYNSRISPAINVDIT